MTTEEQLEFYKKRWDMIVRAEKAPSCRECPVESVCQTESNMECTEAVNTYFNENKDIKTASDILEDIAEGLCPPEVETNDCKGDCYSCWWMYLSVNRLKHK